MNENLLELLEKKVECLLEDLGELKRQNESLRAENARLVSERAVLRASIDTIVEKIDRVHKS